MVTSKSAIHSHVSLVIIKFVMNEHSLRSSFKNLMVSIRHSILRGPILTESSYKDYIMDAQIEFDLIKLQRDAEELFAIMKRLRQNSTGHDKTLYRRVANNLGDVVGSIKKITCEDQIFCQSSDLRIHS